MTPDIDNNNIATADEPVSMPSGKNIKIVLAVLILVVIVSAGYMYTSRSGSNNQNVSETTNMAQPQELMAREQAAKSNYSLVSTKDFEYGSSDQQMGIDTAPEGVYGPSSLGVNTQGAAVVIDVVNKGLVKMVSSDGVVKPVASSSPATSGAVDSQGFVYVILDNALGTIEKYNPDGGLNVKVVSEHLREFILSKQVLQPYINGDYLYLISSDLVSYRIAPINDLNKLQYEQVEVGTYTGDQSKLFTVSGNYYRFPSVEGKYGMGGSLISTELPNTFDRGLLKITKKDGTQKVFTINVTDKLLVGFSFIGQDILGNAYVFATKSVEKPGAEPVFSYEVYKIDPNSGAVITTIALPYPSYVYGGNEPQVGQDGTIWFLNAQQDGLHLEKYSGV